MGNLRKIKRSMTPKIAMADAHVEVNGCRIFLGHPSESKALSSAKGFKEMLATTIARARCPNLSDLYNASFEIREKLVSGEPIWN